MFRNLKDKIATQVTKTNQTILSNILPIDSTSLSRDSDFGTSSVSSRDENHENNRSRLESSASDISQVTSYVSPTHQSIPPSDIESEQGESESEQETTFKMQKLLQTYKNKFTQLKKAYDEVEHEKDNIKEILQKYQDAAIKRKAELREQVKAEKQANDEIQSIYQKELKFRDEQIAELMKDRDENQNLHKKISKLETTVTRCEGEIQNHQEKRAELIIEREGLLQKLNEKQAIIKDRRLSVDEKLLQDNQRLEEELESTRVYLRQLEANLKEQQKRSNEELTRQNDELRQRLSSEYEEQFNALKAEHEKLTNELEESKQLKDALLEKTQQTELPDETVAARGEEVTRLQELVAEQVKQSEEDSKEKSSLQIQLEHFKSQSDSAVENYNSLREQFDLATKQFQAELEEKQKDENLSTVRDEQNERHSQLELQVNQILSEKSNLENQYEQTVKEFEIERNASRTEIDTLKSEIISLININEENTSRIDVFADEKFNIEQELTDKDRQITERDEQIHEIQSTLEQTKETNEKLRRALQNMKESLDNTEKDQTVSWEVRFQELKRDYEQRLKEQEMEYNVKLKALAKEMSVQIEGKERSYQQQLQDFIQNNQKTEKILVNNSEERITNAEQRALVAEEQMSKMDEQLKEKQLDHYRAVQILQNQIQSLTKEISVTTERSSQTIVEDMDHSHLAESTELDYLKQIILAYMTGTDRLTMVKVICAVLRYTDAETLSIIEHERLRQSRWLNSSR